MSMVYTTVLQRITFYILDWSIFGASFPLFSTHFYISFLHFILSLYHKSVPNHCNSQRHTRVPRGLRVLPYFKILNSHLEKWGTVKKMSLVTRIHHTWRKGTFKLRDRVGLLVQDLLSSEWPFKSNHTWSATETCSNLTLK